MIALLVAAGALAACATPLQWGQARWTNASFFKGPPEADIYADYLAARYAGMVGDPVEAAGYYRRAYEREPTSESLETAVFASLMAADMPSAVRVARAADSKGGAASTTAQLTLAVDDIAAGRGDRALRRLDQRPGGLMNAEMVAYLRAWMTASAKNDVRGAVEMLNQPVSRRASPAEAACVQGLILMNAGRSREALERLSMCDAQTGAPEPVSALHAQLLASAGDFVGAGDVLADSPAGDVREALRRDVQAVAAIPAPKVSTAEGAALTVLIASSSGLARASPQIMTIRMTMALHLDPKQDAARLTLAQALDEQARHADALRVLTAARTDTPYHADFRLQTAQLHLELGQTDAAIAAAGEAASLSSRRSVQLAAAGLLSAAGRLAEAEAMFDRVVEGDIATGGRDWRALYARASVRQQLGQRAEAEADAVAALELEPHRPELLNFLGYAWVDRGVRVQEGMDLIRRAMAASPGQGYIIDSLGWAHYRLGEYDKAVDYLEQAAALSPNVAEIIDHLGDAYWRVGRTVEAGYEWRSALTLTTDADVAEALRRKIEHGLDAAPPRSLASAP